MRCKRMSQVALIKPQIRSVSVIKFYQFHKEFVRNSEWSPLHERNIDWHCTAPLVSELFNKTIPN